MNYRETTVDIDLPSKGFFRFPFLVEQELFNDEQIARIEERYNASYCGDFCVGKKTDDAWVWYNQPVAIFWTKEASETYPNRYIGLYFAANGNLMITNGDSAAEPFSAVRDQNETFNYSPFRHAFRYCSDKTTFVDGGRDYVRTNVNSNRIQQFKLVDGKIRAIGHLNTAA